MHTGNPEQVISARRFTEKIMIKNPRNLFWLPLCFMPIVFPETAAIILTAGKWNSEFSKVLISSANA